MLLAHNKQITSISGTSFKLSDTLSMLRSMYAQIYYYRASKPYLHVTSKSPSKSIVHDLEHILTPSKCSSPFKECSHAAKFSLSPKFGLILFCNGSFPLTEAEMGTDTCTECFPDHYIVLCRTFSTGTEMEMDPFMETFPDHYCTHFRDGSPSQGQISVRILLYFNKGIGIRLCTSEKTCLV